MKLIKQKAVVRSNEKIAEDIYSLWLENHAVSALAGPGQFLSLYCEDESRLLPRPISICEIDRERSLVRIVFRTVGKGTREFAERLPGSVIDIMGPLGNGYTLQKNGRALLVAGGIGIPPMLELAKQLHCETSIVLGFRSEPFLISEFAAFGTVYIATEDGRGDINGVSHCTKGTVMDAIRENSLTADMLYACGPIPMLRAIRRYSEMNSCPAQISLEERMACGIGACLGCICKTKEKDAHSHVNNSRICTEGPVFYASEVDL